MSSGSHQEQDQQPAAEPSSALGKQPARNSPVEEPWVEPPVVYTDEYGKVVSKNEWKKMSRNFESQSGLVFSLAGRKPDHWDERRFKSLDKLPGAMEKFDEEEFDKDFQEAFAYSPPRFPSRLPTSASATKPTKTTKAKTKTKKKAATASSEEMIDVEDAVPPPSESRAARAERRASRKADWPRISPAMKKQMVAEAHKTPDGNEEE